MAVRTCGACPMMGGATGFHHDLGRRLLGEKAFVLLPRQTFAIDDATRLISDRHLEFTACLARG